MRVRIPVKAELLKQNLLFVENVGLVLSYYIYNFEFMASNLVYLLVNYFYKAY